MINRLHNLVYPVKTFLYCIVIIGLCFFIGCDKTGNKLFNQADLLDKIHKRGELIVLTRNAPTTFYEGREGPDGYEYQLVKLFAESLGVPATYKIFSSVEEILSAMKNGEGDIAAAGITRTETREKLYTFGPDYKSIRQQIVCHRKGPIPRKRTSLTNMSILLVNGSSYVENMEKLKTQIPGLKWDTTSELSTEQLLEKVWRREIDCTIADSNIVALNQRYYPELKVAFAASDPQHLAWVIPKHSNKLQKKLAAWFEEIKQNNLLAEIDARFYGHIEIFDYVDTRAYKRSIINRLPMYQQCFQEAAEKYDLPWTTLAAQAYQESHWNAKAISPTGVRGIMMLTRTTAKHLGIESRLDPRHSIDGGAKYMAQILRRMPEDIKEEEKLWFAMAAYNVGIGHLWDARTLARRQGKTPGRWMDIQKVFPLLSQKKYYKDLKYGYARGTEPVRYVNRIRNYQEILERKMFVADQAPPTDFQYKTAGKSSRLF